MKKTITLVLIFVLTLCLLAGCRGKKPADTTAPSTGTPMTTMPSSAPPMTTMPTTQPTVPSTASTMPTGTEPGMEEMLPGTEDTVDPTNGANQSTAPRNLPRH